MYRTHNLQRMVSTSHGQRRILKKSVPVAKYIRQAVESGTYYPLLFPEKEQRQNKEQQQQRNSSNKAPYGSNFRDLPIEYEILTLYPPIPPPPRLALKERRLRQRDSRAVPTEKLVENFLKRQQQMNPHGLTTEEYYDRLLGIPPPSKTTAMGNKSAILNKAYAFALRQYEIMRTDDSITEQESIDMVNQLLEREKKTERYSSRKTSNAIQEWRRQTVETKKTSGAIAKETTSFTTSFQNPTDDTASLPSILHSKPRAIEGMSMWSQRLRAVPYREWTIGASTALDHWIARAILELEEDVWQELLQGDSVNVRSQGNDIIAVRQSLFPETILDGSRSEISGVFEQEEPQQEQQQTSSAYSEEDKSIDELLKSLGGFDDDDDTSGSYWPSSSATGDKFSDDDLDSKVQKLVGELQEWRQRNVDLPYEGWFTHEKDEFALWLDTYVETLSNKREGQVDLVATRKALLDSPPIDKEESDKFWQQVRDETDAEILLQSLRNAGTAPSPDDAATPSERKARQAFALYKDLPYNVQLQKLVDLGTLRPIMDEYTSESDRIKFLARYGEKLMEGVEMEHLVPDAEGPIRGDELGRWGEENGIGAEERFRMEMVAYGSDEFGGAKSERARAMYHAWNTQKAGRARFEEIMFKKNRLGLRYNLDDKGKVRTESELVGKK